MVDVDLIPANPSIPLVPITKVIDRADKVGDFMREFLKNGGSATKAAISVGNYKNIQSASSSGAYFLKKAKALGLFRVAIEKRGYDLGKMVDVALAKMEGSQKPEWWDRIMKMADYEDFLPGRSGQPNVQVTTNIFAAHRKLAGEYVEGQENIIDGEEVPNGEDAITNVKD